MAYWGGHVQVDPHVYIVYWGWGEKGAFPASQACKSETITEGTIKATLKCDPDGAGKYIANWSTSSAAPSGPACRRSTTRRSSRPASPTSSTSPTRPTSWRGSGSMTATRSPACRRPRRAIRPGDQHLHRPGGRGRAGGGALPRHRPGQRRLRDRPAGELQRPERGRDRLLRLPRLHLARRRGRHLQRPHQGISYTNMPYALTINSERRERVRRERRQRRPAGKLDGFSIVLGHEIEETITDPAPRTSSAAARARPTSVAGTTRSTPTRTATSARGSARAWCSRRAHRHADPAIR